MIVPVFGMISKFLHLKYLLQLVKGVNFLMMLPSIFLKFYTKHNAVMSIP